MDTFELNDSPTVEDGDEEPTADQSSPESQRSIPTTTPIFQTPIAEDETPDKKTKTKSRTSKRRKLAYDENAILTKCVDILSESTKTDEQKNRATILGESTTSLLETLLAEDFSLYREYASALRDLNNKFEQAYEENLQKKAPQNSTILISSEEPFTISTVDSEIRITEAENTVFEPPEICGS